MYHKDKFQKTEASAAREAGGLLAEFGFEVVSEFLPASFGLISLLFYAVALILLALIWVERTVFKNL